MATRTLYYIGATGQTLYVFPIAQSLTNWTTYRVAMVEGPSQDLSKYIATIDDTNGYDWAIFVGSAQPLNWQESIGTAEMGVDVSRIDNQGTPAVALADQYDGTTGLTGGTYPQSQSAADADKAEILAALVSTGDYAFNVVVTVDDGTNPVENALVRIVSSANATVSQGTTDASGNVTLTADAGTYSILASKDGYTGTSAAKTVTANTTQTLSITANTIPSVTADQAAGSARLLDGQGNAIASTQIKFRLTALASGEDAGLIVQDAEFTVTTDGSGYVSANFVRGATYQMRIVSATMPSSWVSFDVPDAASFTIPALVA